MCFDKSGVTLCGEIGAGTPGAGVTIDPTGGPNKEKGFSGEVGVEFNAGVDYYIGDADIDGGIRWDPSKGDHSLSCSSAIMAM